MASFNAQAMRAQLSRNFEAVIERWAIWIGAIVIGGACAALGFSLFRRMPSSYPDFIVGYLTLTGGGKARDYAMLLGFILGAVGFFAAMGALFQRLSAQRGTTVADDVYQRFIIAIMPAMAWVGTCLIPRAENIGLFWISVTLVCTASIALALSVAKLKAWSGETNPRISAVFDSITLLPIAVVLSALALGMISNRLVILNAQAWTWVNTPKVLYDVCVVAGLIGLIIASTIIARARTSEKPLPHLRTLLVLGQVLVPALLLAVLPLPENLGDRKFAYPHEIATSVWVLLGTLTLLTWADLVRLWRKAQRSNADPQDVVSIFSLIAIVVFCRVTNVGPIGVPVDDYHAGEDLIPWWAWIKHGMLPLWDFTPPRGLINYKSGLFAALFTENTTAGQLSAMPYYATVLYAVVFVPVSFTIGKWRAAFILTFAALDDRLGDIDALMAASLCILAYAWIQQTHVKWLVTWLIVGTVAVLIAPGQGGILVIATLPGGLWRLYQAWREDRAHLMKVAGITFGVFGVLALATPLGKIIIGAVRYGMGQSAVNGLANGIPWQFGTATYMHPWLFEVIRFSWVGAGAAAIILTVWAWVGPRRPNHSAVLFVGTTVAILCVVFIIRSAVRIDANGFIGRPGWASIWAMTLLLPLLVTFYFRGARGLFALTLVVALGAPLSTDFGTLGIDRAFQRPFMQQGPFPTATVTTYGAELGMANLGTVSLEKAHLDRLVTVKRTLDNVLKPKETFLDMTNHGASYYYFDRKPPSDLSSFYNTITPAQQQRAVIGMVHNDVPLAIIGPDVVKIDSLTGSLRAPLVYRHLLLNFAPVVIDGYDYMVRKDQAQRVGLTTPADDSQTSEDDFTILERNFKPVDFDRMPLTFGKSIDRLEDRMRTVVALDKAYIDTLLDAEATGNDLYRVTGPTPGLTFDLSKANIRGRDAGLLSFDYECQNRNAKPAIELQWAPAGAAFDPRTADSRMTMAFPGGKGTMIVPLDTTPRWLLSPTLGKLHIQLKTPDGCTIFKLSNIVLAQRVQFDEMDEILRKDGLR